MQYTLNISAMNRASADTLARLRNPAGEPLFSGFRQAAAFYLGYIRRRFDAASKGDGTWPDLALSTKLKRARATKAMKSKYKRARKSGASVADAVKGMKFSILRDTGTLFNSLFLGDANTLSQMLKDGIRVGTTVFYAAFHQDPTVPGRPPQRRIIVDPDPATEARMRDAIQRAVLKALTRK